MNVLEEFEFKEVFSKIVLKACMGVEEKSKSGKKCVVLDSEISREIWK